MSIFEKSFYDFWHQLWEVTQKKKPFTVKK